MPSHKAHMLLSFSCLHPTLPRPQPSNTPSLSRPKCTTHQHPPLPNLHTIESLANLRGYALQNASVGPVVNFKLHAREKKETTTNVTNKPMASLTAITLPGSRLHIETYRSATLPPVGNLLHVTPGMLLFIAALAYAHQRGARTVYGLAILDAPSQHRRLVRYLERYGGTRVRRVTDHLSCLPDRIFYGGIGTIISGDIHTMLRRGHNMLRRSAREQ